MLLLPRSQDALIALFVPDAGVASADELQRCLRHLFAIVAVLVLLDGVQTILSGVIQARGRRRATLPIVPRPAWHDGSWPHAPPSRVMCAAACCMSPRLLGGLGDIVLCPRHAKGHASAAAL